jgi:hypothetical protein
MAGVGNSASNTALPDASVVTCLEPRNLSACSKAASGPPGWRKNSSENVRDGAPVITPWMMVLSVKSERAAVMIGKFW